MECDKSLKNNVSKTFLTAWNKKKYIKKFLLTLELTPVSFAPPPVHWTGSCQSCLWPLGCPSNGLSRPWPRAASALIHSGSVPPSSPLSSLSREVIHHQPLSLPLAISPPSWPLLKMPKACLVLGPFSWWSHPGPWFWFPQRLYPKLDLGQVLLSELQRSLFNCRIDSSTWRANRLLNPSIAWLPRPAHPKLHKRPPFSIHLLGKHHHSPRCSPSAWVCWGAITKCHKLDGWKSRKSLSQLCRQKSETKGSERLVSSQRWENLSHCFSPRSW